MFFLYFNQLAAFDLLPSSFFPRQPKIEVENCRQVADQPISRKGKKFSSLTFLALAFEGIFKRAARQHLLANQ